MSLQGPNSRSELLSSQNKNVQPTKRKFSDHDILMIQKLKKDLPKCPGTVIEAVTGIARGNIPKIVKGGFKFINKDGIQLDDSKYQEIKIKIENEIKKRSENLKKKKDYDAQGKKQALAGRCCSSQTMKNIIKEKLTNESYEEISKKIKYKKKDGSAISMDIVMNICKGKYKLFLEDFDSKKEYDEYLKIVKTAKPVNTGKRRPQEKQGIKYATRILPTSELIKILKLKGKKTTKDILEMKFNNFEGREPSKIKLTEFEQVGRIWRGITKIYDSEFTDEFTKEDYKKIIHAESLNQKKGTAATYTPTQKDEIINIFKADNYTLMSELAKKYGINRNTIKTFRVEAIGY